MERMVYSDGTTLPRVESVSVDRLGHAFPIDGIPAAANRGILWFRRGFVLRRKSRGSGV